MHHKKNIVVDLDTTESINKLSSRLLDNGAVWLSCSLLIFVGKSASADWANEDIWMILLSRFCPHTIFVPSNAIVNISKKKSNAIVLSNYVKFYKFI